MLFGAYGPAAAQRVDAAARRLPEHAGDRVDVLDRGALVLALRRSGGPTSAEEGGLLCVLDGEVLEAPWRDSTGRTDAACSPAEILRAWRALGEDIVTGMRGSFVLVLWEQAAQSGLLARDPTGLRPLFQARTQGALAFASEINQLLGGLPQAPAVDAVALAFWLSNDNCWADRTFFEGVTPLRPGRMLSLFGGNARERVWWRPRFEQPADIALPEAAAEVTSAITRSLSSRLRPAEDVGVLLSGGLDSGSVAALACRIPGVRSRLTAYSAVFPGHPQTDERTRIGKVASTLGIASVQMAMHAGSPTAGVLRFIEAWGVPPPSMNCLFWPVLTEHARGRGVRLLLGGEGGDELFACSTPLLADRLRGGRALGALNLARRLPGGDRQTRATLCRYLLREAAMSTLPVDWLRHLARPSSVWSGEPPWLGSRLAGLHRAAANPLAWRDLDGPRWWAYTAHTLTVGREIIGASDGIRRLYARDGLRLHHPLLDPEIIELVLRLPPELAYDPRFDRPLLRAAVDGLVPEAIRTGVAKSDFLPVLVAGIAGSDLPLARELLLSPQARLREFVRQQAVGELLDGSPEHHRGGEGGWAIDIWRLLAAEFWLLAQEDANVLPALLERSPGTSTSFHLEPAPASAYDLWP